MSCVLEILSEHELIMRKKYLINQIKNINQELSNRNIELDDKDDISYLDKIEKTIALCGDNDIQSSANYCAQSDIICNVESSTCYITTNNNISENKIKKIKIKVNIKKK
jgi:hypothetical protein